MDMSQYSEEQIRSIRRGALIAASLTAFLSPFMGSSVNVALPDIGQDFKMGAVLLGWVNLAFLLVSASMAIPFGRLGDIWGRKRFFMAGLAVFTLASVWIALAWTGPLLIAGRAMQGVGSAMITATGMAILISVFPPEKRGKVLGINVAAVYLGLSAGPFIGGMITEYLGWRALFWMNLPIGLLLLVVGVVMLKGEWIEDKGARYDLSGALILSVSLFFTLYAFSQLPSIGAFILLALGCCGLGGFSMVQHRSQSPIIDVRIFYTNRVFTLSNIAALINYAATFAVTFLISIYLQKVRGFSPNIAGIVLVSQPLMQTFLSPPAGRLSDRVQPRFVASSGMASCFLGLILLCFVDEETSLYYIIGCLILLGIGFAAFSSPNTKAVMGSVDRRIFGVASAVLGTMRQMGMTFSMGIVIMILALYLGEADVGASNASQYVDGMRYAFMVFAVLCLVGVFASLARGHTRN